MKDPKIQKEKSIMFKRHLAANHSRTDDVIKRKMEILRCLSRVEQCHYFNINSIVLMISYNRRSLENMWYQIFPP